MRGLDPREPGHPRPRRGRRRDALLHEVAVDLREATGVGEPLSALDAHEELGVRVLGPGAEEPRLLAEGLGLVAAPAHQCEGRPPERHVPAVVGQPEPVGVPRVAPRSRPRTSSMRPTSIRSSTRQLRPWRATSGSPAARRRGDHLGRRRQPLVEVRQVPDRHPARVERRGERPRVAHRAGVLDRLAAEGVGAPAVVVVELDRRGGPEQARPQRRVAVADQDERLLQQADDRRGSARADRHAQPAGARARPAPSAARRRRRGRRRPPRRTAAGPGARAPARVQRLAERDERHRRGAGRRRAWTARASRQWPAASSSAEQRRGALGRDQRPAHRRRPGRRPRPRGAVRRPRHAGRGSVSARRASASPMRPWQPGARAGRDRPRAGAPRPRARA